ncbi:MAG: D-2-hydroxyacid dehydrogenase [Planctomycetota bacterium]|jgi:phosphoglycerate dehydrogenase-like enzyme
MTTTPTSRSAPRSRTSSLLGLLICSCALLATNVLAIAQQPGELLYIAGSLTADDIEHLKETAPNVRIVIPQSDEELATLLPQADGMDARYASSDALRAAERLVWVQSPSSGVDRYLRVDELRESETITLTNMRGVHAATIAEHAYAMLLTLTRDMAFYTSGANRGTWSRTGSGIEPKALHGRTLFVVGLGGIGSEVAKIGKGFGMRVVATKRSRSEKPPYVDELGIAEDHDRFLAEADVVAICLPLTEQTRGMFDADSFESMKPGAYVINVGRGPIIDTDALVDALESGHLAGACLDVTDPEPLPRGHALWDMPNVVITPHVSSRSQLTSSIWKQTYLENIRRFGAGEPLLNIVDKQAGY